MTDDEIVDKAEKILRRKLQRGAALSSPDAVRRWLNLALAEKTHETFHVTYLDSQHRVLGHEALFEGTIDGAAVYPRRVVERSLHHNAAAIICSHNHPSGVAEPSAADRRITERIQSALALIDVRVLDHFIVTGGDTYSFAESGLI